MDTLDAKLIAERARLVALLSGLANGLGELPPERLAECSPSSPASMRSRAGAPVRPRRERVPADAAECARDDGAVGGAGYFGNPE